MAREHYRKNRKERIRCKSCGILFCYMRGRTAKEAVLMHIGLTPECNRYYNRRNADGYEASEHQPSSVDQENQEGNHEGNVTDPLS